MFDSKTQHTDNHVSTLDSLGPITSSCDSYIETDSHPQENHGKISNLNDDVIQFRPNKKLGDESGVCSPPLWSKSPPRNSFHPQESHKKIKNSPPSLRVQAITRGQVELMEMVKAMPESLYELSLKDLVDHQKVGNHEHQVSDQENVSSTKKKVSSIKKQGSIRKQASAKRLEKIMSRTGSNINSENNNTNGGLFLKMVFPMPFGGSKKKAAKSKTKKAKTKTKTTENPYAKVSTKAVDNDLSGKSDMKNVNEQQEWWRRRYSVVSDDSESSGLSSKGSSGSSGSNDSSASSHSNQSCRKKSSSLLRACSPFHSSKNKTKQESETGEI